MTLLWTLLGVAVAAVIARYNKSYKLFWALTLAYLIGYAGTVMCTRAFCSEEEGGTNLTQVYPTQMPVVTSGNTVYLLADELSLATYGKVTASAPVSQVTTPALREIGSTTSEVYGRTRDQPLVKTLIKPPELCLTKAISTLHDSG